MRHLTRTLATFVAALTVSLGAVALAAPAHADSSWDPIKAPTSSL